VLNYGGIRQRFGSSEVEMIDEMIDAMEGSFSKPLGKYLAPFLINRSNIVNLLIIILPTTDYLENPNTKLTNSSKR
jgi:hypothetical protein